MRFFKPTPLVGTLMPIDGPFYEICDVRKGLAAGPPLSLSPLSTPCAWTMTSEIIRSPFSNSPSHFIVY
jgi:hypothetical protein